MARSRNRFTLGSTGLVLGLTWALSATLPAAAGEIYQWKDAKGVTHYSQTPPTQGAYKQREISNAGEATPATEQVVMAKPANESPQCAVARSNIEALKSQATTLQQDTDGDGKLDKTLSDADRVNQLELAQAAIRSACIVNPAKP